MNKQQWKTLNKLSKPENQRHCWKPKLDTILEPNHQQVWLFYCPISFIQFCWRCMKLKFDSFIALAQLIVYADIKVSPTELYLFYLHFLYAFHPAIHEVIFEAGFWCARKHAYTQRSSSYFAIVKLLFKASKSLNSASISPDNPSTNIVKMTLI